MSGKIFIQSAADKREAQLVQKLERLAKAGDWDAVITEMDRFDENNERRHREHRDDLDVTIVDREPAEGESYRTRDQLKLSCWTDWDEIIFSQKPEDLHQLVEEYPTSAALKELTATQKRILWENLVWSVPTKDIAKELGCSVRNVTKHRQKAIETVRQLVTGHKDL